MRSTIRSRLLFLISFHAGLFAMIGLVGLYRDGLSVTVLLILSGAVFSMFASLLVLHSVTAETRKSLEHLNVEKERASVLAESLRDFGTKIVSSSDQMKNLSHHLTKMMENQTTAVGEAGGIAKRISSGSSEFVEKIKEISPTLRETENRIVEGQEGLQRMESMIRRMETAAEYVATSLDGISEKAGRIGGVLAGISKVSAKTSLLSFNAAIEAEKAGELGHGFAVVGREVRQLSDEAEMVALDLERMLKAMTSAISAGKTEAERFNEHAEGSMEEIRKLVAKLVQIIAEVQKLAIHLDDVVRNLQDQSTGAGQIEDAVTDLSEAIRQTVESLEDSSRSWEQLSLIANELLKEQKDLPGRP